MKRSSDRASEVAADFCEPKAKRLHRVTRRVDGIFLLIMAILGGLGLFLLMPGGRRPIAIAGVFISAAATALLVYALVVKLAQDAHMVAFSIFAVIGFWGALRMITHSRPVYSALYFILVVISTTGMLFLAEAEFLAGSLLIIYAGAILVTYLFVIMLASQSGGGPASYDKKAREPFIGVLSGFVLLALIAGQTLQHGADLPTHEPMVEGAQKVAPVATTLLTTYMIGIQIVGVLLLAAMVGAVAIARRQPHPEEELAA